MLMLGSCRGIVVAIAGLALSGAQPPEKQADDANGTQRTGAAVEVAAASAPNLIEDMMVDDVREA